MTKNFTGERPGTIDHRNPPKPQAATKSDPKPDHFTREKTAPISAPAKKPDAAKPKSA
jgi:hypothetical protein